MLRLVALLLMATPTAAQDRYIQLGDEYQLTREGEHVAVVEYLNDPARMSTGHDVELAHDGLEVVVHTRINGGAEGAERVTVTAPEGWSVDPPYLDVIDGQGGTIILSRIVAGLM